MPKNAAVRVKAEEPKYVCRAGFKLEKALDQFGIDVSGLTALDAGLSTGGFTDCLLQREIRHVSIHTAGHLCAMLAHSQHQRWLSAAACSMPAGLSPAAITAQRRLRMQHPRARIAVQH